jgi:hypothetical protein
LLLAEHQHDLHQEGILALARFVAAYPNFSARRVQKAREDFERRRLAGSVGSEKTDPLAGGDVEVDSIHRGDRLVFAPKERSKRRGDAGRTLVHRVVLAQGAHSDHSGGTWEVPYYHL